MLKALLVVRERGWQLEKGSLKLEGRKDFVGTTRVISASICCRVPHQSQDLKWVKAAWRSMKAQLVAWVSLLHIKSAERTLARVATLRTSRRSDITSYMKSFNRK